MKFDFLFLQMYKTPLNNDYQFDVENFLTVISLFEEDLQTQTVMVGGDPKLTVQLCEETSEKVMVGLLILRLSQDLPVFFEDDYWLNFFAFDVVRSVMNNNTNLYFDYLKSLPISEYYRQINFFRL
jgi:hypothetical protein